MSDNKGKACCLQAPRRRETLSSTDPEPLPDSELRAAADDEAVCVN